MGFLSGLFGGSDQSSSSDSSNRAYPWLQSTFGNSAGSAYNGGVSGIEGLLGMSGGDPQALQKFWNSTGGNFLLNQGTDAINSNFYARGLGESGAAMKALEGYRQNLASTKLNDLMQNYMGLAKLGLGGGDLISNAGVVSHSEGSGSSSNGGLGQLIGAGLSIIPFL